MERVGTLPGAPELEQKLHDEIVRNETGQRLVIEAVGGAELVLAPFERRKVSAEDVKRFALGRWGNRIVVETRKPGLTEGFKGTAMLFVLGLAVFFVPAWGLAGIAADGARWWKLGWITLAIAFLVAATSDLVRSQRQRTIKLALASARWARTWGGQQLFLIPSVIIAVLLPATGWFFGGDIMRLIDVVRADGIHQRDEILTLIGRGMQLAFIWIASLLPALLFFLFDREHLDTLRNRFLRQIVRFDPTVRTRGDVLAKYQHQMKEAYGRDLSGRILPGRRSPLLLATTVVTLGWMVTLLHGDFGLVTDDRGIIVLFEPRQAAMCFAFLGAYFYGINAILRGYVRKDLRPKMYSTLTVRILVVVILAWVLELGWHGDELLVLAFLTGVVPETALVLVKELSRSVSRSLGRLLGALEDHDPLTDLEGIDLYDRARLFDEGVNNVESLAHHDLVELMLQTRSPAQQLVDWVDQAILYLHAGSSGSDESRQNRRATLDKLRAHGIRTATDLDTVFAAAAERRQVPQLLRILDGADGKPPPLQTIKDAIDDDEWMVNLRHWRDVRNSSVVSKRLRVAELPGY